jgi:hypothetical protein
MVRLLLAVAVVPVLASLVRTIIGPTIISFGCWSLACSSPGGRCVRTRRGRRSIGDGGLVQGVKQQVPTLKSSRDTRRLKRRLATLGAPALQQNRARRIPVVAATVRPDRSTHLPGDQQNRARRIPVVAATVRPDRSTHLPGERQNRARRIPVVAATVRPDRSTHLPGERRGDPGRRAPAVPGGEVSVR